MLNNIGSQLLLFAVISVHLSNGAMYKVASVDAGYPVTTSSEYMADSFIGCYSHHKARLNSGSMGSPCGNAWEPFYSWATFNYVDWI